MSSEVPPKEAEEKGSNNCFPPAAGSSGLSSSMQRACVMGCTTGPHTCHPAVVVPLDSSYPNCNMLHGQWR